MSKRNELVSLNERNFCLEAFESGKRIDGRALTEYRNLKVEFGVRRGHVRVELGETKVLAVTSFEMLKPAADYPTEGYLNLHVSLSQVAPLTHGSRANEGGIEISRIIERGLRNSGIVNLESLCIIAGEKVWSINTNVYVLDENGNLLDCCAIATICALHHFRRPEVMISGENEVYIRPDAEKLPIPISMHVMPIWISFALYSKGIFIVDPSRKEEAIADGKFSVLLGNKDNEIYSIQKQGGVGLSMDSIKNLIKVAQFKVHEIIPVIKTAFDEDFKNSKTCCLNSFASDSNPAPLEFD